MSVDFERHGEEVTIDVKGSLVVFVVDDDELKVLAAQRGWGLAHASEWGAAAGLAEGTLRQVMNEWMPTCGGLAVHDPGHRLVPATVRGFVDLVRSRAKGTKSESKSRSARPKP